MFTCTYCGHMDVVHQNWVGRCYHGELDPKDKQDCDCPQMDWKGEDDVDANSRRAVV